MNLLHKIFSVSTVCPLSPASFSNSTKLCETLPNNAPHHIPTINLFHAVSSVTGRSVGLQVPCSQANTGSTTLDIGNPQYLYLLITYLLFVLSCLTVYLRHVTPRVTSVISATRCAGSSLVVIPPSSTWPA